MGVRWLHRIRVVLEEHRAIVQDEQAIREGHLEHLRKRELLAREFEVKGIQLALGAG
jgi:hypothetical protein